MLLQSCTEEQEEMMDGEVLVNKEAIGAYACTSLAIQRVKTK